MEKPIIVVVEDDHFIREVFTDVLEGEGYLVQAYANGKEAMEGLKRESHPSLILLDWMMPIMSGGEFLQAKGQEQGEKKVPVVVVSAVASDLRRLPEVRAYVRKPVDLDQLLNTVRTICDENVA